jgi:HK97 gp10 family phage protein
MTEFSLVEFATLLTELSVMHDAEHEALEAAAVIVETEAKRVLGTYDYEWPELADATKEDRVHQGFSENEPGLRTGEMRDSIEHTVFPKEAYVGSNDDHLVYFDIGTSKQPPRPVLLEAFNHKKDEVLEAIERTMVAHLSREPLPK